MIDSFIFQKMEGCSMSLKIVNCMASKRRKMYAHLIHPIFLPSPSSFIIQNEVLSSCSCEMESFEISVFKLHEGKFSFNY